MKAVVCPVCKTPLFRVENSYKCENNHCFDISKFGTVNLRLDNSSSKKRHGDDAVMIRARKDFLDKGYYEPLLENVCSKAKEFAGKSEVLLDIGCGEGYYTSGVAEKTHAKEIIGIDVSRDAVRYFKKRIENGFGCVASAYDLPIANESVDLAMNMFAPIDSAQTRRVLKQNGILIRTYVMQNHLIELKQAIYDTPYLNDEEDITLEGFEAIDVSQTSYKVNVQGEDINNLFMMTPYYYKTSRQDQQKAKELKTLDTTLQFKTVVYKKIKSC